MRRVTEKQFVSNTGDDLDVIGVAFDAGMACARAVYSPGKVLGSRSYFPKVPGGTEWVKWWKPLSASSICRSQMHAAF
ncbi:MAG: hypothetical protein ACLTXH_13585 [Enterobacter hormaechei]